MPEIESEQPLAREDAANEVAKASITSIRQPIAGTIATGLSPLRLSALIQATKDGEPLDYLILAEEMIERDGHLRAMLQTRYLALDSLPKLVEAADEDGQDLADLVEQSIVRTPHFAELVQQLADGIFKGYAVSEILWDVSRVPWSIVDFKWRDPRHFVWDRESYSELRLKTDADPVTGEALQSGKFVCHSPRLKQGLSFRGGLALTTAALHLYKAITLRDWLSRSEVYGIPWRIGTYGDDATAGDISNLKSALGALGADAAVALHTSMDIRIVEAKVEGNADIHRQLIDWLNKEVSKVIVGTNFSDEVGGSFAKAAILDNVRQDIRDADARAIERTINAQVIKPWVDLNVGPQERYPMFRFDLNDAEDLDALSKAVERYSSAGVPLSAKDVRDRAGFVEPADPDDTVEKAPAPEPFGGDGDGDGDGDEG